MLCASTALAQQARYEFTADKENELATGGRQRLFVGGKLYYLRRPFPFEGTIERVTFVLK